MFSWHFKCIFMLIWQHTSALELHQNHFKIISVLIQKCPPISTSAAFYKQACTHKQMFSPYTATTVNVPCGLFDGALRDESWVFSVTRHHHCPLGSLGCTHEHNSAAICYKCMVQLKYNCLYNIFVCIMVMIANMIVEFLWYVWFMCHHLSLIEIYGLFSPLLDENLISIIYHMEEMKNNTGMLTGACNPISMFLKEFLSSMDWYLWQSSHSSTSCTG